jgi:soluble lytic murein transglycosylase-like protein
MRPTPRSLRGTYVRRGDILRRRRHIRTAFLVACLLASTGMLVRSQQPEDARADVGNASFLVDADENARGAELDDLRGQLDLATAELERLRDVVEYSSRYAIGADLATAILDIALAEGIDPDLGFRLVKLESDFNPNATSPVGALGLTQLMFPTARYFDRSISKSDLYQPRTNLRIGFRYLRTLLGQYKDVRTAVLVYNRGPVAVESAISEGRDPANGYERVILKGYKGDGLSR